MRETSFFKLASRVTEVRNVGEASLFDSYFEEKFEILGRNLSYLCPHTIFDI